VLFPRDSPHKVIDQVRPCYASTQGHRPSETLLRLHTLVTAECVCGWVSQSEWTLCSHQKRCSNSMTMTKNADKQFVDHTDENKKVERILFILFHAHPIQTAPTMLTFIITRT